MLKLLCSLMLLTFVDARVASRAAQGIVAKGGSASQAVRGTDLGPWMVYTEDIGLAVVNTAKSEPAEGKHKKKCGKAATEKGIVAKVRHHPLLERVASDYIHFLEWLDPTQAYLVGL